MLSSCGGSLAIASVIVPVSGSTASDSESPPLVSFDNQPSSIASTMNARSAEEGEKSELPAGGAREGVAADR